MHRKPEKNFHVVTILGHESSGDPDGAATDFRLLLRSGLTFRITIPERLDAKKFLNMAVVKDVDGRPVSIEFHPKDVRSGSGTVSCRIIAYRQE